MSGGLLPEAVLWDMDGTLVDSEPYWIECEFALAEKYDGTWSREHALAVVGGDLLDSARYIRTHMGIDRTPEQIRDELLDGVIARVRDSVPWRPGARELLAALRAEKVPCALVTMSYHRFADPVVDALPPGSFAAVVCGDDLDRGKPHPDAYLTAMRLLGTTPEACVAIEDSPTGATSAAAAGCPVIVVPCHIEVPEAPGLVHVDTLTGITPRDLRRLVRDRSVTPAEAVGSPRRPDTGTGTSTTGTPRPGWAAIGRTARRS